MAVWRESMRVVPTLGLRSIAAAVAMLDDPTTVAVIRQRRATWRASRCRLRRGFFAGRIEGSYDILITNRLIAQPQFELNFYSKSNRSRRSLHDQGLGGRL